MNKDLIDHLVEIGFSEYEAKAYIALLRKNPVSGYELSKLSGVPRSMIYEVLGKLSARGAALTLLKDGATKYAPVDAKEFLDQLERERTALLAALRKELAAIATPFDLEYVWTIEGQENILIKVQEMIRQAREHIYLSTLSTHLPALQSSLARAVQRGARVVVYTTEPWELPGAQVVINSLSKEAVSRVEGLGLILVIDEHQVLISESITDIEARASWTSSPMLVFIAEHHLRTDPYLPQVLDCLQEQASQIIRDEDRELFARAMESHLVSRHHQ